MFKLLSNLRSFLKTQHVSTDSAVFRMHNVFTTMFLMTCSMLITANQFVGNPIYCMMTVKGFNNFINKYCWISSTFTLPYQTDRQIGKEVAGYGIHSGTGHNDQTKYHTYYQWVCFVLFFQALLCYTPKFLWDFFEGGLMKTLVMGLNIGMCPKKEKDKKKEDILKYFKRHLNTHNFYAYRYWGCELICLFNIIAQLYLMDWFFEGEFLTYGIKVLEYASRTQENRVDPMIYVFPRMTKCTFLKYGPSGTIQIHDSLCILPLNIVNEKTYIFIWFWYFLMLIMLSLLIFYRVVIIMYPRVRSKLMKARNRGISYGVCESVANNVAIGDWWVLYVLGMNMDPHIYRDIINELEKDINPNISRLTR